MKSCGPSTVTTLACWFVFSLTIGGALGTVECMVCSYTFAGTDGQVDIECVTDVYNFTKRSTAQCNSFCTIRTVYTADYKRVNSITRGCGEKVMNECDPPSNVYPTCEVTCSTPRCNDQNGDLWESMKPEDDDGNMAENVYNGRLNSYLFVVFCIVYFFLL